ncbi:MAG: transcription termination factor Rho [Phycisphaeraceae bacterium]|nr:transcription termination factor Rho [Phycisphaeraceae bacterium]
MDPSQPRSGILEIPPNSGTGRLRLLDKTLVALPTDPVIPASIIHRWGLKSGLELEVRLGRQHGGNGHQGHHKHKKGKNKNSQHAPQVAPNAPTVSDIIRIEGEPPGRFAKRRRFEDLTTIDPQPRLTLEYPGCPPACRLIDLFCPIGYGQRGMIVSPPKAGKTILLQQLATAISKNHPAVQVIALLVDERPEEVTDFRRNVPCTVLASSNDHDPHRHVHLAMLAIDRAKRMAEVGKDVVILLDSLTRVGRAFNAVPGMSNSGRTMSGGLDSTALAIPKQLFGAARKFEEGGSLSIIATALVDTGSRADQIIFEEFKGTGNMELILDRSIAERRVFPAIDLAASGTRKEHLLLTPEELSTMAALRRRLISMQPVVQVEQLLLALDRYKTNAEMVGQKAPNGANAAAASVPSSVGRSEEE